MFEKLMGIATVGSALANVTLLHRFLSRFVVVVAFTVISALLTGAILIALFYEAYWELTEHGLASDVAVGALTILAIFLTALFAWLTLAHLRRLRGTPNILQQHFPAFSHLGGIVDAFVDGLLDSPSPPRS